VKPRKSPDVNLLNKLGLRSCIKPKHDSNQKPHCRQNAHLGIGTLTNNPRSIRPQHLTRTHVFDQSTWIWKTCLIPFTFPAHMHTQSKSWWRAIRTMALVPHTKHQHKRWTQHIRLHTDLHATQQRASENTCFKAHLGKWPSKPATRPWGNPFPDHPFSLSPYDFLVPSPCELIFFLGQGQPQIIFLRFCQIETLSSPPGAPSG